MGVKKGRGGGTGESMEPQECLFCSKVLSNLKNLEMHLNLHTRERPYECKVCFGTFRHVGVLGKHRKYEHRLTRWQCGACDYSYGNLRRLLRHEESKHKDNISMTLIGGDSKLIVVENGTSQVSKSKMSQSIETFTLRNGTDGTSVQSPEGRLKINMCPSLESKINNSANTSLELATNTTVASRHSEPKKCHMISTSDRPIAPTSAQASAVDFVLLPLDDPRVQTASTMYPPIPIQGLPEHPPNLFFSVNGTITEPVPSLAYLRQLAPPPSPEPLDSESDSDLSFDEVDIESDPQRFTEKLVNSNDYSAKSQNPLACQYCEMTFMDLSELVIHLVTHTEEKRFTCPDCGKDFAYSGNLRTHQNRKHGRVPVKRKC